MRLLVLDSKQAHALDIVLRAMRDGHDVRWFVPDSPAAQKVQRVGEGLADVVRDFHQFLDWADLILVTDNTTYLRNTDAAKAIGRPVIGATSESAEWELDRCLGMKILEEHGITCPEFHSFNSYDAAIAYVKKHDRPFVSKPSGDADKALSYVARTPADLCYMLGRWQLDNKLKGTFILQEKVEGVEIAVGGWFGPNGFNEAFCENFEFKKLCTGDLGPATGEQGTVLRYVQHSKLARKVLLPLEDALAETGHTGYVDVNTIIDQKGNVWPLEFTMRPGWPTMQIMQELHEGDCVEWMLELIEGQDSNNTIQDKIALGVIVSIPDYPFDRRPREECFGIPIYGLGHGDIVDHVHLCECMSCTAPHHRDCKDVRMVGCAGTYVLCMSDTGDTVAEAKRKAMRNLKRINIPGNPFWRTDIGDRLKKELPMIQKYGYAKGMEFSAAPPPALPKVEENKPDRVIYV